MTDKSARSDAGPLERDCSFEVMIRFDRFGKPDKIEAELRHVLERILALDFAGGELLVVREIGKPLPARPGPDPTVPDRARSRRRRPDPRMPEKRADDE